MIFIALFFNIVVGTIGYFLDLGSKLLSPFLKWYTIICIITSYTYGIVFIMRLFTRFR